MFFAHMERRSQPNNSNNTVYWDILWFQHQVIWKSCLHRHKMIIQLDTRSMAQLIAAKYSQYTHEIYYLLCLWHLKFTRLLKMENEIIGGWSRCTNERKGYKYCARVERPRLALYTIFRRISTVQCSCSVQCFDLRVLSNLLLATKKHCWSRN